MIVDESQRAESEDRQSGRSVTVVFGEESYEIVCGNLRSEVESELFQFRERRLDSLEHLFVAVALFEMKGLHLGETRENACVFRFERVEIESESFDSFRMFEGAKSGR